MVLLTLLTSLFIGYPTAMAETVDPQFSKKNYVPSKDPVSPGILWPGFITTINTNGWGYQSPSWSSPTVDQYEGQQVQFPTNDPFMAGDGTTRNYFFSRYMYVKVAEVVADGTWKTPHNLSSNSPKQNHIVGDGLMMVGRPNSTFYRTGRTMFNLNKVTNWANAFNGNPEYVANNSTTHLIRASDVRPKYINKNGTFDQFVYIRDLVALSGGKVWIMPESETDVNGDGIQDYNIAEVEITEKPFIVRAQIKQNGSVKGGLDRNGATSPPSTNSALVSLEKNTASTLEVQLSEYAYDTDAQSWTIDISGPVTDRIQGSVNTGTSNGRKYGTRHILSVPIKSSIMSTPGTYTMKINSKDGVMRSSTQVTLVFTVGDGGSTETPPPTPIGGSCPRIIQEGPNGGTVAQTLTIPSPSGSISSDNGIFDVVKGIPSSEYLKIYAQSHEYLVDQNFFQKTGKVIYTVKAQKVFTLTWQEVVPVENEEPIIVPYTETETKEVTVQVERPYSFWQIGKYTIHQLEDATFSNYALPGGAVTVPAYTNVTASGNFVADINQHVFPASCENINLPTQTINGGNSKPSTPDITGEAQAKANSSVGQNNVKNDNAVFKGTTIMSDTVATTNGPTPSSVPLPGYTSMSEGGLLIDAAKTNYYQSPSSGNLRYSQVVNINGSGGDRSFPFSVNPVTVHTPVVSYAKATDDKAHDQRTEPPYRSEPTNADTERHAFVLNRPFTVTLPTTGTHRAIPGYGTKDYAKYTRLKQVMFPFDVYSKDKVTFYPANTWIEIPVAQNSSEFYLPSWVPEGAYTTYYRVFAINAPSSNFGTEVEANVNIPNSAFNISPAGTRSAAHVATDTIAVDVVGRLYDFRVTDISDYRWESVFRENLGMAKHSGNAFWVGKNDLEGAPRGNQSPFALPIRQGSHPDGYKNVAVKTGYHFKFDLKTMGDMYGNNDGIRITPTFQFVSKDGETKQDVDLYYHSKNEQFIKVGGSADIATRSTVLNERLRNVPDKQLLNNADYYYRHGSNYGMNPSSVFESTFIEQYINDFTKRETLMGAYSWLTLPWQLRTFIGPEKSDVPSNAMVPQSDAIASEQQWYGEYSIPADVYAVEKGTNIANYGRVNKLKDSSSIFLKDGYIIVNFNIETIQKGNTDQPYLQYINTHYPQANQWKREGFEYSFVDPYGHTFNLEDGDVIFYHSDESSYDDFQSSVTH